MTLLPNAETAPFGHFAPDRAARLILGVSNFDVPHRRWPLRRKVGKFWLRRSSRIFDLHFHGLKLRLHPASNVGDEGIVLNGIHGEEDEFAIVRDRVSDYDNFIDIGANIGLYSLIAARALPAGRPVVAFEPDPQTVSRLETHLKFNQVSDRVTVVRAAVGEEAGELTLYRPPFNIGGTSAHKRFDHWIEVRYPVVHLARKLNELGVQRLGMLKIDIEGFEDRAIMPFMEESPEENWPRYILIEVCHRKFWKQDVIESLQSRGYREVFRNTRNIHFTKR